MLIKIETSPSNDRILAIKITDDQYVPIKQDVTDMCIEAIAKFLLEGKKVIEFEYEGIICVMRVEKTGKMKCNHSPYDRDVDDIGRTVCLNCGEFLPQFDHLNIN